MLGALGHITPDNFDHVKGLGIESELVVPKPVAIGVNWYTSFDSPSQLRDGSYHLPDASKQPLGSIRGGHCVCLVPMGGVKLLEQSLHWWRFYDQGPEGACEPFGHCKCVTLEKGFTVDPWPLYDEARKIEGTFPNGEGTTNTATVQAMQQNGVARQTAEVATRGLKDGAVERIAGVRWTKDVQEVLNALGRPGAAAVPVSNNWGEGYPLVVWLPVSTLERLLSEEGEADSTTAA